jgi:hypothetical protein
MESCVKRTEREVKESCAMEKAYETFGRVPPPGGRECCRPD